MPDIFSKAIQEKNIRKKIVTALAKLHCAHHKHSLTIYNKRSELDNGHDKKYCVILYSVSSFLQEIHRTVHILVKIISFAKPHVLWGKLIGRKGTLLSNVRSYNLQFTVCWKEWSLSIFSSTLVLQNVK